MPDLVGDGLTVGRTAGHIHPHNRRERKGQAQGHRNSIVRTFSTHPLSIQSTAVNPVIIWLKNAERPRRYCGALPGRRDASRSAGLRPGELSAGLRVEGLSPLTRPAGTLSPGGGEGWDYEP